MSDPSLQDAQALHLAGRLDEAAALYRQLLRANPRHFEALRSLGKIYFQVRKHEQAQYFLGEAVRLDPEFLDGLRMRGVALMHLNRHEAALKCFERALVLKPDSIDALVNRAAALLELNRLEDALAAYDRIVALSPGNAVVWSNRGSIFVRMRRYEEAVACYDRALAIQPGLATVEDDRFNALLRLRKITRISNQALRETFDSVSPGYDKMMLGDLGYRGHLHVRTLAERVLPRLVPPYRILDLGCGTGLVGEAFKDLAAGGALDAIDVAPRMIERARARGIYGDLILADFEVVLAQPGPSYDLILSADTMIYLGDLWPTFWGVANRLVPAGFYIFACEAKEGEGWELTPANRFRHSEAYLRAEAERAGLEFAGIVECSLRSESGAPVPGFAVALKMPAGSVEP